MSWLALFLGLILALAGGAGLVSSLDLLTTELGVLYATCGSIAVSGSFIVIAIGLLIRRVDALRRAVLHNVEIGPSKRPEPEIPPLLTGLEAVILSQPGPPDGVPSEAPASVMNPEPAPPLASDNEPDATPINENRSGHLPSLDEARKEPPLPPTLVGRYKAGSANYSIFSDGSIEAETDQGAFKFGSMSEFKSFIAARRS